MKSCLVLLFQLFWLLPFKGFSQSGAGKKPNSIFILADDLGYADLSFPGGKDVKTPHIDAMAAKGIFMKN